MSSQETNPNAALFFKIGKFVQCYKSSKYVRIFVRDYLFKLIINTSPGYMLIYDSNIIKNFMLTYHDVISQDVIDNCATILELYNSKDKNDYLDFIKKFVDTAREETPESIDSKE